MVFGFSQSLFLCIIVGWFSIPIKTYEEKKSKETFSDEGRETWEICRFSGFLNFEDLLKVSNIFDFLFHKLYSVLKVEQPKKQVFWKFA